jgi:hypothetical protein
VLNDKKSNHSTDYEKVPPKLSNVLISFQDEETRKYLLRGNDGDDFEKQIFTSLTSEGFEYQQLNRTDPRTKKIKEYLKKIKPKISNPLSDEILDNELFAEIPTYFFVNQPYGPQKYPDFLIFTDKKIYELDSKYSNKNNNKVMWNGAIPKKYGIYIFGSFGLGNITFFNGKDLLMDDIRKFIVENYEKIKKLENDFDEKIKLEMSASDYFNKGFSIYIRKAYKQIATVSKNETLNLFKQPDKGIQEENVIKMIRKSE